MARTNWTQNNNADLKDHLGQTYQVGDRVVKPATSGRSAVLEIRTVAKIEGGKIWLDNSHVPLNYPGRCLIINNLCANNGA